MKKSEAKALAQFAIADIADVYQTENDWPVSGEGITCFRDFSESDKEKIRKAVEEVCLELFRKADKHVLIGKHGGVSLKR